MSSSTPPRTTTTTKSPNSPLLSTSHRHPKTNHHLKVSCKITSDDHNQKPQLIIPQTQNLILPTTHNLNVHRRSILLGLAGLYTTVTAPNTSTSVAANQRFQDAKNTIKEFVFPEDTFTRIRPAAHRVSGEYVAKYKSAIKAMRDLPDDHPHSFIQQAKIHRAYCNGGYSQTTTRFPDPDLQIHNSWLFFPFHRWYLYFYERILGKLINDPTFAIPYWNWDHPSGMTMPEFFEEDGKSNPAFDPFRDARHIPPAIVDLNYNVTDIPTNCTQQITNNLTTMYKEMIRNAPDSVSFFGGGSSIGSIESGCHTGVHRWVGDPRMPYNEDMGNLYSAGNDPLFYVHHANVDRMWKIWKDLGIRGHVEPKEPDWLNGSYVFYDEHEHLVRVYNKDCVKLEKLNYDYEFSPILWVKTRPTRPVSRNKKPNIKKKTVQKVRDVTFPMKLDRMVTVRVKRPDKNRSEEEKETVNEMLLINGIEFNGQKFVKFDVFVNDRDDVSEFVGSFGQLPRKRSDRMPMMRSAARFGLNEVLEEIDGEDDGFVRVTLVPRSGCEEVTVGEIKVELVPVV